MPNRRTSILGLNRTLIVILVAAQDVFIRYVLYQQLRKDGHTVFHVSNIESALSKSAEHDGLIHLLVSVYDPPAMDALELRRRLQKRSARLKTVLVVDGPSRPDSLDETVSLLLRTPFKAVDLRA